MMNISKGIGRLISLFSLVLIVCFVATIDAVIVLPSLIVKTSSGVVQGFQQAEHNVFLGVPYAAPPVGNLRWQPPQPAMPWSGVFNATEKGPICPQLQPSRAMNEDCLSLNIYVPTTPSVKGNLPVYIFIHGGSFYNGNGGDFNGTYLSGTDMIFVSMNYRLGALGYLGLPEMANNSAKYPTYGFFGVQDQRLAFSWVKDNIQSFGGNPYAITIGGQSAGAISVCIHLATPRSAGLFHQALMESGECTINEPPAVFSGSEEVAKNLGCTGPTRLECMLNKTAEEVSSADNFGPIWPCLHPYEIMEQPVDLFKQGIYNRVPLLIGTCHDEQSFEACPNYGSITAAEYNKTIDSIYNSFVAPAVIEQYPVADYTPPVAGVVAAWSDSRFKCPTLEAVSGMAMFQEQKIFMYEFLHVPSFQTNKCMNVSHSTELAFVFPSETYKEFYTSSEIELVGWMRDWWVSFVSYGTPVSNSSNVVWEPFQIKSFNYLGIDLPSSTNQADFDVQNNCGFWAIVEPSKK